MRTSCWSLESSAAATELKRFIAEKCAQVRAETRPPEHPMSPKSSSFFAAAERCDWPGLFDAIAAMHQDLSSFRGDPRYIENEVPQRRFSKLRSSIGGLYAWRAQNIQGPDEKERMLKEADLPFDKRSCSALAARKRCTDTSTFWQAKRAWTMLFWWPRQREGLRRSPGPQASRPSTSRRTSRISR